MHVSMYLISFDHPTVKQTPFCLVSVKLHLSGHSIQSLRYLGDTAEMHTRTNEEDKLLFESWKVRNRTSNQRECCLSDGR